LLQSHRKVVVMNLVHRATALQRFSSGLLPVFIVLLVVSSAFAQTTFQPLVNAWSNLTRLELTDTTTANSLQPSILKLLKARRTCQLSDASLYSLALLELSRRPKISPKVKLALVRAAIFISPHLTFPETALAKLQFQQGHYWDSWCSFLRALKKFRTSQMESFYASTFFWLGLAFIPLALLLLLGFYFSYKYFRVIIEAGDLKLNRSSNQILLALGIILGGLVVIIPAPLPGLLLLVLGLALFASRRDNLLILLSLASLLIIPFAYEQGMTSLLALDSSFFKTSQQNLTGLVPQQDIQSSQSIHSRSQLILQLYTQAENARLRGNYRQATIFLEKMIDKGVELVPVYNNLGNLYQLLNEPRKSIALYQKAIKLSKDSAPLYFNLSQAYLNASFDLAESTGALEKALQLMPELHSTTNNESKESFQHPLAELKFLPLPQDLYQHYASSLSENVEIFLPEILSRLVFPGAGRASFLVLIFLSLLLIGTIFWHTPANRSICHCCGRLFFNVRTRQNAKLCYHCRPRPGRRKPPGTTQRYWTTLIIGIIFPGFYLLVSNRRFLGVVLMLPFLLCLYNQMVCNSGIMEPFPPSTNWLCLVLPLLVWAINLALVLLFDHRTRHSTFSLGIKAR